MSFNCYICSAAHSWAWMNMIQMRKWMDVLGKSTWGIKTSLGSKGGQCGWSIMDEAEDAES